MADWRIATVFCFVTAAAGLGVGASEAAGQDAAADPRIGSRVMIIRHGAPMRTPEATVWTSYLGEIFEVSLANGEWLWIEEKGGWLWEKETVPYSTAIDDLSARLARNPSPENFHLRGVAFLAHEEYLRAVSDFDESLRRAPRNSGALNNRGKAYYLLGDHRRAIRDFDAALNVEPSNVMFLNNRALAHLEAGSSRSALKDLQSALLIVPDFTEALNNRGIVYMRSEDHSSALKDFNAALKLDPKFVDALGNRASALRKQGRYSEAVLDLENAIMISPGKFEAVNDLAWLLATCPDNSIRNTSRALTLARQACDMTDYRQWNTLDTLAAALAGEGQFSEAARHAAESVEMAPRDERRRIRGHLDTITAGKPVREQLR